MTNSECLTKIKTDPEECPFCGSGDLDADRLDPSDTGATSEVSCNNCGAAWTERFTLTSVEITNDPNEANPTEPDEGDYTTEDHIRFWQHQYGHRIPVVIVPGEEDWRPHVKAHMDKEQFWPSVWFLSDHGNWHLLSLEDDS